MLVGVFPLLFFFIVTLLSLPHACGGVSNSNVTRMQPTESSPCLWGCFSAGHPVLGCNFVFPMLVGVFLATFFGKKRHLRLPHACGGVSSILDFLVCFELSSPCLWGCFCAAVSDTFARDVFPMLVGVFPCVQVRKVTGGSLPHACGGVSHRIRVTVTDEMSSPCLWGCFQLRER